LFLEFQPAHIRYPRWVRVLNIPTYVFAFLLGIAFPYWQPYSFFLVSLLTGLVYSFFLSRAVQSFLRIQPPRPAWQLAVAVVSTQLIVLVAALYLLSA
jgi:hypothetical protein